MDKIAQINSVLKAYFEMNPTSDTLLAKEFMPQFIKAGIFVKDHRGGLPIRKILRALDKAKQLYRIPFVMAERKPKNTNWYFANSTYLSLIEETVTAIYPKHASKPKTSSRKSSDEHYVIDLCDKCLGKIGLRQHRFDFLLGDTNAKGNRAKLPIDVYYPDLNLVVEYEEYQHSHAVNHFDKPDVITVSIVHRGEQRKIYDLRRKEVLPKHGIQLVVISYELFDCDRRHKIVRDGELDLLRVKEVLEEQLNENIKQ
ncbi:MAG: hypothetical protein WCK09_15500 [Bacteroidota bacterium]